MMFMNGWEIEVAADRWKSDPVIGPATQTLLNLRDCADGNSDGWAYWVKPCRAAKSLQELIQRAEKEKRGWKQQVTVTPEEVCKAYRPIKSFLTRHALTDCCEIVPPGKALITPYGWCIGSPTKQACAAAGYCRRSPSCGD